MPYQAELNGKQTGDASVGEVTSHFSGLAYDLITLTELQAKLTYLDLREAGQRSAVSFVCLIIMMVFTVSAIPVVLLGVSELLIEYQAWHRAGAYLFVGGIAFIGAIAGGFVAAQRLKRVSGAFARSHQELQENLEFIKRLVRGPETDESAN